MSLLDSLIVGALPFTPRFIVGRVARRYIAGESIADAVRTIQKLNAKGAVATVDVLGEFIEELSEARETAAIYERMLDAIAAEGLRSGISIKPTAMGLNLDADACFEIVHRLASRATDQGLFVRIDMEDSPVTDATLELVRRLHGDELRVGAVLQAYLHRTVADARALGREGISVRLCKGIYREPEEIAYQDRERVRQSYREALGALLDGTGTVGIATHDEVLVADAEKMLAEREIAADRYEFQMLLGVREWLRDELLAKGHQVRIYVPFGDDWYGYSKRRLRENPEIAGHVFRAMLGRK